MVNKCPNGTTKTNVEGWQKTSGFHQNDRHGTSGSSIAGRTMEIYWRDIAGFLVSSIYVFHPFLDGASFETFSHYLFLSRKQGPERCLVLFWPVSDSGAAFPQQLPRVTIWIHPGDEHGGSGHIQLQHQRLCHSQWMEPGPCLALGAAPAPPWGVVFFLYHGLVVLDVENIPLIPGINLLVYIGMVWNSWPQENGRFTALLRIYNDQFISPFHEAYPDVR